MSQPGQPGYQGQGQGQQSHGRVAYEAYKQSSGGQSVKGEQLPEWDAQDTRVQQHWEAAARAVQQHVQQGQSGQSGQQR